MHFQKWTKTRIKCNTNTKTNTFRYLCSLRQSIASVHYFIFILIIIIGSNSTKVNDRTKLCGSWFRVDSIFWLWFAFVGTAIEPMNGHTMVASVPQCFHFYFFFSFRLISTCTFWCIVHLFICVYYYYIYELKRAIVMSFNVSLLGNTAYILNTVLSAAFGFSGAFFCCSLSLVCVSRACSVSSPRRCSACQPLEKCQMHTPWISRHICSPPILFLTWYITFKICA